jgi:hypothetical protein
MSKIGGVTEVNSLEIADGGRITFKGTANSPVLYLDAHGALVTTAYTLAANSIHAIPYVGRYGATLLEMNTGFTLLPAVRTAGYRLSDMTVIAIGGTTAATAAATGLAIYGTQAGASVKLFTCLLAALIEDAVCRPNVADTSVLAGGASFQRCDYNTAITCKAVSAGAFDLITAVSFDVHTIYSLER